MRRSIVVTTRLGIRVVLVLGLSAQSSLAALDKCQAAVEKATAKLQSQVITSITACEDSIAKEIAKGARGNLTKAANTCETTLAKVFDKAKLRPGHSAIATFQQSIDSLFPKTCTAGDLVTLGHMISGAGGTAPPGTGGSPSAQDWVKNWLAVATIHAAILQEAVHTRNFLDLLGDVITATGDCTSAQQRPNVCQFAIQCRSHACNLSSASSATLFFASQLPLGVSLGGNLVLDVCPMKGFGFGLGDSGDLLMLMAGPQRTIKPVSIGSAGSTAKVCIDTIAAEGWCDCVGLGIASVNASYCQDHVLSNGDGCSGSSIGGISTDESPCFCDSDLGVSDQQCGPGLPTCPTGFKCGKKPSGGVCHPGTTNGPVKATLTGASTQGDCVVQETLQFTNLTTIDTYGADGLPCTADDTIPPSAPVTVPLTTGTAVASIKDAIRTEGSCDNGAARCIEDANCGDKQCVGAVLSDISSTAITGAKASSCTMFDSTTLSGVEFVGSFPTLDGGGLGPGLGDVSTAFRLSCP